MAHCDGHTDLVFRISCDTHLSFWIITDDQAPRRHRFLGTTLDRNGKGAARWNKWRPTIGLCQQPDLPIDRLELIHGPSTRDQSLADRIRGDIQQVSPGTEVRLHPLALRNPWDFEEVYGALHDFASGYRFDTEHEDYLVHITTGTHVAQICWFLLTEARYLPARLVQTSPSRKQDEHSEPAGIATLIDLDLSRYDPIASRFRREQVEGNRCSSPVSPPATPASTAPLSRSNGSPCARRRPCCWSARPAPASRSWPAVSTSSSAAAISWAGVSSK